MNNIQKDNKYDFKNIFYNLRQEEILGQTQIAKRLNVSQATVAMWENGKRMPSLEKMEEIADFFNVDIDYLYGRQDVRKKISFNNDGDMYVNIPEYDNDTMEIVSLLGKITPEQKQTVLAMLRSFAN